MLPTNAASDISMQDALDLLHKLRAESTKVLAVFLRHGPSSGARATAGVVGVVWRVQTVCSLFQPGAISRNLFSVFTQSSPLLSSTVTTALSEISSQLGLAHIPSYHFAL
jgi:hypothetical protein